MKYRARKKGRAKGVDASTKEKQAAQSRKARRYVGSSFHRDFGDLGVFKAEVKSYNETSKYLRLHYEHDDDEEDVTLSELENMIANQPDVPPSNDNGHSDVEDEDKDEDGELDEADLGHGYFASQVVTKTSDNKLEDLQIESIDPTVSSTVSYEAELKEVREMHEKSFPKWLIHLRKGVNLLFYGLGSKFQLLEAMGAYVADECRCPVVVAKGYCTTLTLRQILQEILSQLFPASSETPTLSHVTRLLREAHARAGSQTSSSNRRKRKRRVVDSDEEGREDGTGGGGSANRPGEQSLGSMRSHGGTSHTLCIVIHSIDSINGRSRAFQTGLSVLAEVPGVHLMASVDHVNSPLLWDSTLHSRYRWMWVEACTYRPYAQEITNGNPITELHHNAAVEGTESVLTALTSHARAIFKILADHQLRKGEGLLYYDLYDLCRKQFFARSEATFNQHLHELRDHEVLKSKRTSGGESLSFALSRKALQKILDSDLGAQ